jgi:hypothetical protein
MRPNRSIWTYVADPATIVSPAHGDTCFNPATGESWVRDNNFNVWNPFRLTNTAGYGTAGYMAHATIAKLTFDTEVSATLASTFVTSHAYGGGFCSLISGYGTGSLSNTANIDKLIFSADTTSSLVSTLSFGRSSIDGINSFTSGYICGGAIGASSYAEINKLDFISDTNSSILTSLSVVQSEAGGWNAIIKGYTAGGQTGVPIITVHQRLTFSNDSVATVSGLIVPRHNIGAVANSRTIGYLGGGDISSVNVVSTVEKFVFSSEVGSAVLSTLSSAKQNQNAVSSYAKGYFVGSDYPSSSSTIDRLNFSNESITAAVSTIAIPASGGACFENMN